jgi:hypothetical protein
MQLRCGRLAIGCVAGLALACAGGTAPAPAEPKRTHPSIDEPRPRTEQVVSYDLSEPACALCWGAHGDEVSVRASSTLEGSDRYAAARVLDGDKTTAWCEGAPGAGVGEALVFEFARPMDVYYVEVWGGYFGEADRLHGNGRLKRYRVSGDAGRVLVTSADAPRGGDPPISGNLVHLGGQTTSRVEITIDEVWPGDRFEDTCVSQVVLHVYAEPPGQ